MRFSNLEKKRVAMLGLGVEARALITSWRINLPHHPLKVLTNLARSTENITTENIATDTLFSAPIQLEFGTVSADRLRDFDVVIKSPGFSPYREPVADAIKNGVRFTSASAIWFAENPDATTVCITGTKGKSTTAALLNHILISAGLRPRLAGNIGRHMLEFGGTLSKDLWIIELSSYQARDFAGQPSIGVVLNLYPEHLDWHLGEENYYNDKLEVLRRIASGTGLVNGADQRLLALSPPLEHYKYFNDKTSIHCEGNTVFDGDTILFELTDAKLKGLHNRSNICAAISAAQLLGLEPADCRDAVLSFCGLPHRLFNLGERSGLTFIDDSLSTTPHATIAAMQVFSSKSLTVLVGGHDRGIRWNEFADFIEQHPIHAIITMPENGPLIAKLLRDRLKTNIHLEETGNLDAAVSLARKITPQGGVILLSPGAPSFGAFANYKERGETFARLAGFEV